MQISNLSRNIRSGILSRQDRYVNTMQGRARLKLIGDKFGDKLQNMTHMEEARMFVKLADKNEAIWLSKHPVQKFLLKIFK